MPEDAIDFSSLFDEGGSDETQAVGAQPSQNADEIDFSSLLDAEDETTAPAEQERRGPLKLFGQDTGFTVPDNTAVRAFDQFNRGIGDVVAGDRGVPPEGFIEGTARGAGQSTAAALTFFLPSQAFAISPAGVKAAETLSKSGSGIKAVAGEYLASMAKEPVKMLALEELAALGGGGLRGAVSEVTDSPTAQFAAELVGGLVAPLPGLVNRADQMMARRAAIRTMRRRGNITTTDSLRDAIALHDPDVADARRVIERNTTLMQESSRPVPKGMTREEMPLETNLEAQSQRAHYIADKLQRMRSNAEPMPADMGGKGTLTLRNDIARSDPAFDDALAVRRAYNMVELERVFDPDLPGDLGAASVQQKITAQNEARLESVAHDVIEARRALDAAVDRAGGTLINKGDQSEIVADALVQAQANHTAKVREMYKALPKGIMVQAEGLRDATSAMRRQKIRTGMPEAALGDVKRVLRADKDGNAFVEFSELRDLDQSITEALIDTNTTPREARLLGQIKDEIEVAFDGLAAQFESNELAAAYREAREYAKAGYRIYRDEPTPLGRRTTAAGEVIRGRRAKVAAESTLKKFWKAGSEGRTASGDFLSSVERMRIDGNEKGAKAAEAAMNDYIFADFVDSAFTDPADGVVNQKKAKQWLRKHRDALEAFPDTADNIEAVVNGSVKLDIAESVLAQTQREVDNKALRAFLGADDPDEAVHQIMKQRDATTILRQMVSRMGNDTAAINGLKRSVLDDLRLEGFLKHPELGPPEILPGPMLTYIKRHEMALTELFGKKQVNNWKRLARYKAEIAPADATLPSTTRGRTLEHEAGSGLPTIAEAVMSITTASRAGAATSVASMFAKKWVRRMQFEFPAIRIQKVVEHALMDQDFMDVLMQDLPKSPNALKLLEKRWRSHMYVILKEHGFDDPREEGRKEDPGRRISMATDRAVSQARAGAQ